MISIFLNRVFRAIKIDIDLYEEVEKDKSATVQAGTVVVLSSLAAGVGALQLGVSNFLLAPALSLLSWYVWAYVIYFVGVKLFGGPKTKSNHGELLRTIGFSSAPGLIRVFGVTPDLMTVTFIGSAFWMLACMVVAVKSALDYESLWKALGVVVVALGAMMVLQKKSGALQAYPPMPPYPYPPPQRRRRRKKARKAKKEEETSAEEQKQTELAMESEFGKLEDGTTVVDESFFE